MYLEIWAGIKKKPLICSMRPQCSFSTSKSTKWVFQHVWIELSPNTCTVVRYISTVRLSRQHSIEMASFILVSWGCVGKFCGTSPGACHHYPVLM